VKKKARVRVTREGRYFPHVELLHGAGVHLAHVEAKHDGFFYSLLSSFLLSAFSLEAFLNYAGPKVEKEWTEFERAPTLAKLVHICTVVGVSVDFSRRPFQTINELFQFRNRLAHPRDEKLKIESDEDIESYQGVLYSQPLPKWMEYASVAKARMCSEDIKAIINLIESTAHFDKDRYAPLIGWSGSASAIQNT